MCMVVGVKGGKQVVREQVATGKFTLREPSAIKHHTHSMHASVETFMETNFSSNLHLGQLDIEGLHRLCCDFDTKENQPKGNSSKVEHSANPLGK